MNIGQHMGGRHQAYSDKAKSIREANPLPGHEEFVTSRKLVDEDERAALESMFSKQDSSEFAPRKAVEFNAKTAVDELLYGSKDVRRGHINPEYLKPYVDAPHDRAVADSLKQNIVIPFMQEAMSRYKGMPGARKTLMVIKDQLKSAIYSQIQPVEKETKSVSLKQDRELVLAA